MAKKKEVIPTEAQEQIKLIAWLKKEGIRVSASANGGSRNFLEAVKLKRMGVSPGFPDLEIPLPRGKFHGLYIELKRQKGGKVSELQREWLDYLSQHDYYVKVVHGFDDAKETIEMYLSL